MPINHEQVQNYLRMNKITDISLLDVQEKVIHSMYIAAKALIESKRDQKPSKFLFVHAPTIEHAKYLWTALVILGENIKTNKFSYKELQVMYRDEIYTTELNDGISSLYPTASPSLFDTLSAAFSSTSRSTFSPTSLYETVFKQYVTADMFDLEQIAIDLAEVNRLETEEKNAMIREQQESELKKQQDEARHKVEESKRQEILRKQRAIDSINKSLLNEINGTSERLPNIQNIRRIISKGADINFANPEDGYTPLMIALTTQNDQIAEYLLNQGADPLIRNSYNEIASNLVSRNSLIYSILKGYELIYSVRSCNLLAIKKLLRDEVDINFKLQDGYTPLLIAVQQGAVELVEYLLSQGADPSITSDDGKNILELTEDSKMLSVLNSIYQTQSHDEEQMDERYIADNALTHTEGTFFK